MQVPSRGRGGALRFNVTPLIDIVFLLVIFFLAASHLVRVEATERVDLPTASQAEDERAARPNRLTVTVDAGGTLLVGGEAHEPAVVTALIETAAARASDTGEAAEVRLRVDRTVPYSAVEPLLLACAGAGVSDVKFAVLRADGSPVEGGGD